MCKAGLPGMSELRLSKCATLFWLSSLFIVLCTATVFSGELYFGVIQDKDGYSYVRKGPGVEYEVVDTLREGEEFLYEQQNGNWWKVYSKDPKTYPCLKINGYLHRSRILQTNRTPTVGAIENEVIKKFSNEFISVYPQTDGDKANLKLGIVKLLHGEYNIHDDTRNFYLYSGPGKNYRPTIRRWDGYPYLYKQELRNWIAVYNTGDTVLVGYAPENDIEQVTGTGLKTYYISYFDNNGKEIGFMGSCSPGWDSYFIVPDTLKNELLVAYKEMLFSPNQDMARDETMLEIVREDCIAKDLLPIIKSPCLLYKSMTDFNSKGMDLLRYYFQRFPIYTDSSFVGKTEISKYLPALYNPIAYKPIFGEFFERNVLEILNDYFGKYCFFVEGFETNRISFKVNVRQESFYLIYYYQNATYLISRKAFRNVDYPLLNLGPEFEQELEAIINLDVVRILEQYRKPIFINQDIIIYLTTPQRQLFCKVATNFFHGLEGKVEESANGLIFFEIEDGQVAVAGSTVFSRHNIPLMFYSK